MQTARRRKVLAARAALTVVAAAMLLAGVAQGASARVVWLCKPGQHPDPCTPGLSTTFYSPTLHRLRAINVRSVRRPKIDCFYVYPTVSSQPTVNANLTVDPVERSIAHYQAARYSQYCRVFAPMYRQVTLTALLAGKNTETPSELKLPVKDVSNALRTYLTRYNHGRGFVLMGHSQGSLVLRQVIASDVDRRPAVRKRLLSAILLGGNVLVKKGRPAGGDFKHVPACRMKRQLGCVIAFSMFDQPVPANSLFGRTTAKGKQVLCTNPASLGGGSGKVTPIYPTAPFYSGSVLAAGIKMLNIVQPAAPTVWSSQPGAYRARCSSAGGANVLQVSPLGGAQVATPSPDPTWGLHLLDSNIALGNLLTIVRAEAVAFAARAPGAR
jgi:hypothetical protein